MRNNSTQNTPTPSKASTALRAITVAWSATVAGTGAVLAVLIGVNVGPNLTYVGSLATLLWRRIVQAHDHETPIQEFTMLGLLATPLAIVVGVVALWGSLLVLGGAG